MTTGKIVISDKLGSVPLDEVEFRSSKASHPDCYVRLRKEPASKEETEPKEVIIGHIRSLLQSSGGIFPFQRYHTLPSPRLYWSLDADVGVELVAKAMSRYRFEEILRFLPSTDNQALNKDDKRAKIRPLMNHLNTKVAMAYPMDQHISLDEAMIEYFSWHGCKQCIRNKPVRFGFKSWCLDSPLGYLATFDVYQGIAFGLNRHYEERFGKGGDTLMILFEKLPSHIKDIPVRFYFNYFTSLPLVNHLQEINYGATGTIRDNRIPKTCPINSTNEMKDVPRGDTDVVVDNIYKILLVRWKDNAVVSMVSNISPVYPLESVSRWSAKDKKKISVSQTYLIGDYNRHMGGTDRMDQNINCYRISITMKKWWWPIFSWVIDATIQNCWLLHRVDESNLPLLSFKRYIARTYPQQAEPRVGIGRPRQSSRVIPDVRYDNIGHLVEPLGKQEFSDDDDDDDYGDDDDDIPDPN
ncbi:piggyBac transposable element-derived protein 3-like [Palaemon carinicauda]|uniref:piggyBac transposable element-derived protein 3-like n=1 Tax=Palaemon carinicauda TaxID=392227 RepID=UPI0035B5FA42